LLPSAKCTRPLFQGRTGCGGRPSGWHDIVTCQHLVYLCSPNLCSGFPRSFLILFSVASVARSIAQFSQCLNTHFFAVIRYLTARTQHKMFPGHNDLVMSRAFCSFATEPLIVRLFVSNKLLEQNFQIWSSLRSQKS